MPAALLPAALPKSKPVPAPIAAPGPARPVTEPIAAPAAAPITVPGTALAVAASAAACPALPVVCCAYWLQAKPSAWNSSKLLFVPGRTITLGPLGTVTHALRSAVPQSTPASARRVEVLIWLYPFQFLAVSVLGFVLATGFSGAGQHRVQPSASLWDNSEAAGSSLRDP